MSKLVEVWKPVKNFEGIYEVSNLGRVKSLSRPIKKSFYKKHDSIMKGAIDNNGYHLVILRKKGYKETKYYHRLVWDYFGDKQRNKRILQIDHIDNNKLNNRIDNLQLLTQRGNTSKYYKSIKLSSIYTGVDYLIASKKWRSRIVINNHSKYLGLFKNEIDAHKAYQKALKEINDGVKNN